MGADEAFVLLLSTLLAVRGAWWWYAPLLRMRRLICPIPRRLPLLLTPALCLAGIGWVLLRQADPQVRRNPLYVLLFLAAGFVCLMMGALFLPILGISPRDDALQRSNPAAMLVVCAALLAVAGVYCGSNIGTGPTIWTTLGPAALGIGSLFALWLAMAIAGGGVEAITVDRDLAAALRMAAAFVATAAVLSRAVAGNWVSIQATLHDFLHLGWPAAAITILAAVMDRSLRPSARQPRRNVLLAGLLPAMPYLVIAVAAVWIASPA